MIYSIMQQLEKKKIGLSYVDYCVYWYTYEALEKWFLETLRKRFHVNFLGYPHWFMSIRISQMKQHYISVDKARYATSIVSNYLDTVIFKTITEFYKNTLPSDMMFTKDGSSTIYEQVKKLTSEFNINIRACIGSLNYLQFCSTQVSKVFIKYC